PLVYDVVLAAVLSVAAVVEFRLYHPSLSAPPGVDLHMAAVLLFTLPLAIRRRHPVICVVLQIAGSALVLAQPPYTAIFASVLALLRLRPRPLLPLCLRTAPLARGGLDTQRRDLAPGLPPRSPDAGTALGRAPAGRDGGPAGRPGRPPAAGSGRDAPRARP